MSERTLKVSSPHMTGDDVRGWQRTLLDQMDQWGWKGVHKRLKLDGDYGVTTRTFSSLVLKGLGIAQEEMARGITPELRIKVRNRNLSVAERRRAAWRTTWRVAMRRKFAPKKVRSPIRPVNIDQDSWGWHPGIHDGIDLICDSGTPLYAIVKSKVVRADADGWWALGAKPSPGHPVSDGDGIIVLESLVNSGPIKKGMHLCYGHAEHARVKEGDTVDAGDHIGSAGFANAGHVHFMVNDDRPVNGLYRGVGDRDPEPIYRYARKRG